MDDQGTKPSVQQIDDELAKQESEFGEVLPEDQEHGDIDQLHQNVTGVQNDSPADELLGEHNHTGEEEENDTPKSENN